MSVTIFFKTNKKFNPEEILKDIAETGEQIMVTSDAFPCLKFGRINEGLRGIEINEEEDGYGVRICSLANKSDHTLFRNVVKLMSELTITKGWYEYDENDIVENPETYLNDSWIEQQMEFYLRILTIMIKHSGSPFIMDGLFFPICIGAHILRGFEIDLQDPAMDNFIGLQHHLTKVQWIFADKNSTQTRLAITNPKDDDDRLTISVLAAKNGKVEPVDLISYANLLGFMDEKKDGTETLLIKFEDFSNIIPPEKFMMLDEYQAAVKEKLTYKEFCRLKEAAKLYEPENLFDRPTFPGNGYQDEFNTFVLMWNPAISSVSMEDHNNDIPNILTARFNWSVRDYEKAKKGDKFIMIRCGQGRTGLVMSGIFDSNPYEAGDWSGKGRRVFYMELKPNFIADPEKVDNFLSSEELSELIPSFDWKGGASGRLLTHEQALKLEFILSNYLSTFNNNVDSVTVNGFDLPQSQDE